MALTATLALDVSNFQRGLSKAEVELQTFARASKTVNRDLTRLLEDFSGQRVTVEASRMAEAVQRIGGASRLTASEQARVNTAVTAAIDKYRVLGQEAPANLIRLQKETARASTLTGSLGSAFGALRQFLPVLGAAGLVGGLTRLASASFETAGRVTDLANRTGLSTDAIQRMQVVANQTGTSLDAFTNAAFKLGVNIEEGTAKVRRGVADLGLAYEDLRKQSPEQQFATIIRALEGVDTQQERNRIGAALFGRQFAEIAASVQEGYSSIADAARVSSEDQLRALDAAGDAWQQFKDDAGAAVTSLLGTIVLKTQKIKETLSGLSTIGLAEQFKLFGIAVTAGVDPLTAWAAAANQVSRRTKDIELTSQSATPSITSFSAELAAAQAEVASLTDEQRRNINAAIAMGATVEDVTRNVGISEAAFRLYKDELKGTAGACAELKDELSQSDRAIADNTTLVTRNLSETGKLTAQLEKWAHTNSAVLVPSIRQVSSALESQEPLLSRQMLNWAQFAPTVEQSTTSASSGISGFFSQVFGGAEGLGQSISSIFQSAFTGGGGALGAVQAFATQTLSTLMAMIPGIGPFLSGFAGPIVAMLSRLGRQVKDFFRGLFGASRGELNDRGLVQDFEEGIIAALSSQQQAESGGERWRQIVIGIRDAYIAAGRTAEEAERDVARLWESSREGGEETWRVIDEIQRKMQEQAAAGSAAAADMAESAADSAADAIEDTEHRLSTAVEGMTDATEAAVRAASVGAKDAARSAIDAIEKIGRELDDLPDVVDIEVRPSLSSSPGLPVGTAAAVSADAARVTGVTNVTSAAPRAMSQRIEVPVYLDGYQVAMATVPHIPGVLRRRGAGGSTWP